MSFKVCIKKLPPSAANTDPDTKAKIAVKGSKFFIVKMPPCNAVTRESSYGIQLSGISGDINNILLRI